MLMLITEFIVISLAVFGVMVLLYKLIRALMDAQEQNNKINQLVVEFPDYKNRIENKFSELSHNYWNSVSDTRFREVFNALNERNIQLTERVYELELKTGIEKKVKKRRLFTVRIVRVGNITE